MDEIDKLLANFPDDIADLTKEVCGLVSKKAIDATPRVQLGWKVITYQYDKAFCAVAPHKQWVNLQLHAGANLPDPSNLLEGTGKSMRHVKIKHLDDLDRDVGALVEAAAKRAQSKY